MKTEEQDFMRESVVMLILVALALTPAAKAGEAGAVFYVQLICGTDTQQPPVPGCRPVGPRLAQTLSPVFRFKGYWEISRQKVALLPGQKFPCTARKWSRSRN